MEAFYKATKSSSMESIIIKLQHPSTEILAVTLLLILQRYKGRFINVRF
jgi:hypothetical protein